MLMDFYESTPAAGEHDPPGWAGMLEIQRILIHSLLAWVFNAEMLPSVYHRNAYIMHGIQENFECLNC